MARQTGIGLSPRIAMMMISKLSMYPLLCLHIHAKDLSPGSRPIYIQLGFAVDILSMGL